MPLAILLLSIAQTPAPAAAAPERAFIGAASPTRLIVVAPQSFLTELSPLIAHKNATGMPAFGVAVESLCESFPGRDDPERIKRALAWSHEHLGTEFVMLAGDASLVPVRFRQVQQPTADANLDGTYNPSELFYANLYHDHEPGPVRDDPCSIRHTGGFDSWDGDGDGLYDEQHWAEDAVSYNPDRVDGCPDLAVGRIPAHSAVELRTYVEKVIAYETRKPGPGWVHRYAFLADKQYPGSTEMCDEIVASSAERPLGHAQDLARLLLNCDAAETIAAPWTKGSFDQIDETVSNSWWVTYLGHAGARFWAVFEAGRGYDDGRVHALKNARNLPIVFAIGCESGMFSQWEPCGRYRDEGATLHEFVWHEAESTWEDKANGKTWPKRLVVPQPHAYDLPDEGDRTFACSWLLRPGGAGAIAYFGESLVCENDKGAELLKAMLRRLEAGDRILGDVWRNGQRTYWLNNRANQNVFRNPRIYLGIMTLFGDPSLRLRPPSGSGG